MTLLFTLGAPNDDDGNLSQIALDRLNCSLNIYNSNSNPNIKIVCTGGFGEHFNKTILPHAKHAQHYLINKRIPKESFAEIIESKNTFEDLTLAKPIIEKYKPVYIIIVTSDFHMPRTRSIFEWVFGLSPRPVPFHLTFQGVQDEGLSGGALQSRRQKEEESLKALTPVIDRIQSMDEFHRFLFMEHRAYSAGQSSRRDQPADAPWNKTY